MTFHSGKGGTAKINGNEIPVISWRARPVAEKVRFRNSMTGSYSQYEQTFYDMTVEIVLDHDFDSSIFGAPISIFPGVTLADVNLYIRGTTGAAWKSPSFLVDGTPTEVMVDGKIGLQITGVCNGPFTGLS